MLTENSDANFAHLAGTGLHYVGSVPASDCPDLTALPASRRSIVDKDRFGGLTAYDTRRTVYGAQRRAILTHSPELRESQARGFDGTTLAKAGKKLTELAATLARGKTRRAKDKVQAEIEAITAKPWVRRVITWQLDGDQPRDLRLTWAIDPAARAALEEEIFGKHVLITDHNTVELDRGCFACAPGGPDRSTLFMIATEWSSPRTCSRAMNRPGATHRGAGTGRRMAVTGGHRRWPPTRRLRL